jgi:AraC-like DNA-binding protein
MLTHALPLTVHSYRKDRLLVNRVKLMLISEPGTMRNAQALAEALHTSVRTLHRQLKDEGATLQGVKDDIRREIAIDLLRRTEQPLKKIALAVGFDNDKSFLRAFQKWTGLTPGQYRNVELKNPSWSP